MRRIGVVSLVIAGVIGLGLPAVTSARAKSSSSFAITSVRAMPGYHRLYAGRLNLVLVVPKLAFRVTILNRDGMQRNVKLHLAVSRGNKQALSSEVVLGTVRAHQARTVTVRLPSGEVTFAQKNWLRVQVAGDSSASSARGYGVIFGLG